MVRAICEVDMFPLLARGVAYEYREEKPYLPQTPEESKVWEVHAWVLGAMRVAYNLGREDQRDASDRNRN